MGKAGTRRSPDEKAAIAAKVLAEMHEGNSLRSACVAAKVPVVTFLDWTVADPILGEQYTRAREACIEKIADDTLRIADEPVGSTQTGGLDSAAVAKQRLQVDTRKWLLSKLAPKKFGDKITQEVTGEDGGPVNHALKMTVQFV